MQKFTRAALLFVILLSGCTLHLSESVKDVVSDRGAHATRVVGTPLGIYFTSLSFVPGLARASEPTLEFISCESNRTKARVFFYGSVKVDRAKVACSLVLSAIRYVSQYGQSPYRIEYEAVIVPAADEYEARSIDFYSIARKVTPQFVFKDTPRLQNAIVGVFVHEYIHLYLDLEEPDHRVTEAEEYAAYLGEICGELAVVGSIDAEDLPGGPIEDKADAVIRSSRQAHEVRLFVYPYLESGTIDAGSEAATALLGECRIRLQSLMGSHPM